MPELPELFADTEEGFMDAGFAVTDWRRMPGGVLSVTAMATTAGDQVGLRIVLGGEWKPGTLGEGIPVFRGVVTYHAVGVQSDQLVRVLASAYGLPAGERAMADKIRFAAIALSGNPANAAVEPVQMKLFFESDSPDGYAEVYTNLDLPAGRAEIREKDEGYRQPLIAAITRGA